MTLKQLSLTIISFYLAIVSSTGTAEGASFTVIADGLDNARGLGFGPDGSLYVAEAGVKANGACVPSANVPNLPLCPGGTSGAVTRIKDGKQKRVLTGLPSIDLKPINLVEGPQDIQFDSADNPYLLIGGDPHLLLDNGTNTVIQDAALNSPSLGRLYSVDFNTGSLTSIADLANYELVNNPDQGDVVSNSYALAIQGDTAFVADAGANDLLSVGLDSSNLTAVTLFPSRLLTNPIFPPPDAPPSEIPLQSVPTGVAIGPDGALYVSELTAFPYPEGEARVYRISADGQPTVVADGFTQITDLEFDAQGNLYVLQYANESAWKGNLDGSLMQVAPDGTRTTLVSGNGLESPTALTIGPDDAIYITNKGDRPGVGQVIRVENTKAVPEPSSFLGVLAIGTLGFVSLLLKRKREQQVVTLSTCQKPCPAES